MPPIARTRKLQSGCHLEHSDPSTEYVRSRGEILIQKLTSHVYLVTFHILLLRSLNASSIAKISNLQSTFHAQQNVLWLQVQVHDIARMNVRKALHHISKELPNSRFRENAFRRADIFEAFLTQLRLNINMTPLFPSIIHLHKILVESKLLSIGNFCNILKSLICVPYWLLGFLDGIAFVVIYIFYFPYHPKRTFS